MRRSAAPNGFSLVELAIVLMVIGLLIGGVLKGRELLDNSRLNSLVMQVRNFETAGQAFKKMYGDLPGDLRNPGTRLPNCAAPPCSATGNGDGMIGQSSPAVANVTAGTSENRNFWLHLTKAGLLSNAINPDYTGTPNTFGTDFPSNPIRGGWHIYNTSLAVTAGYPAAAFTAFRSVRTVTGYAGPDRALSAAQLVKIDTKMDDGLPTSGRLLSWDTGTCYATVGGVNIYPNVTRWCDGFYIPNF